MSISSCSSTGECTIWRTYHSARSNSAYTGTITCMQIKTLLLTLMKSRNQFDFSAKLKWKRKLEIKLFGLWGNCYMIILKNLVARCSDIFCYKKECTKPCLHSDCNYKKGYFAHGQKFKRIIGKLRLPPLLG